MKTENTETKSADALARELAESAARRISQLDSKTKITQVIFERTKLRELCAVAEALRDICALDGGSTLNADRNELCKSMRRGEKALAALDGGGK